MSPLVVFRRARRAGAPYRDYVKLVAFQLVMAIVIMATATPWIVSGVDRIVKHEGGKVTAVHHGKHDDVELEADDEDDDGKKFLAQHAPSLLPLWISLASLYGAWIFIELGIGAVWREYDEALADSLMRAAGVPVVAPPPKKPRVGLDLRWVVQKLWRQLLTAIVFASGAPFFLIAKVAPGIGETLYAIVVTLWGGYWLLVSTAAKADTAWRVPASRPPWFLRLWMWLTVKVPGFRWFGPRGYGQLWTRVTVKLHGAAELLEQRPYAFAGLAVMRAAGQVPLVSIVLRPLLPVAAELLALRLPLDDDGRDGANSRSDESA